MVVIMFFSHLYITLWVDGLSLFLLGLEVNFLTGLEEWNIGSSLAMSDF